MLSLIAGSDLASLFRLSHTRIVPVQLREGGSGVCFQRVSSGKRRFRGRAMTEAEWLAGSDPTPMLAFLRGTVSDRKLRLFAVTCCQSACRLLQSRTFSNAIEVSEQFADGLTSDDNLRKARAKVREASERTFRHVRASPWSKAVQSIFARSMVVSACSRNIEEVLEAASDVCVTANSSDSYEAKCKLEKQQRATLVRDIFGSPFRPIPVEPVWLTATVVAFAKGIYNDRAFDRMPILADALQDAGCENADILNHCWQPGEHVRGCWVVDLLTGRK
jgi:hypothetical protein